MKLLRLRLHCPSTLGEVNLRLSDDAGAPRPLTVVYGGAGAGKTTFVKAVASTRPGHVVNMGLRPSDPPCFARCEWQLGVDEPDRSHSLVLSSPNAPPGFFNDGLVDGQAALAQRREVAFFERLAREGGFAFLSLSSVRWFSRTPLAILSPERGVARYDVRAAEPLDDAGRNDLARDVKQALAYAAICAALPKGSEPDSRHELFGGWMQHSVAELLALYNVSPA